MARMTDFPIAGGQAKGYFALPESKRGPGVVVLHAWWGLNAFMREVCQRLAAAGFVALAPDLYHGATAATIEEAKRLRSKVHRPTANKEIAGALDYARQHRAVTGDKAGVLGFSLGGHWALWLASHRPADLGAVVAFYGTQTGNFAKTQARFLCHFAEADDWVPAKAVQQLEQRLKAAGKAYTFHTYPGTTHWFFESDRAEAYQAKAARAAWQRTLKFLRASLR